MEHETISMRQGQQKRMRGRNRGPGGSSSGGKGPNNLNRTFESNGPDVKVRGTAAHIAEKYVQLARDAQSSGDPILAEAYLQHAEHYFRVIAAAQPQFNGQPSFAQQAEDEDDGEDFEFDGPVPSMPQPVFVPSPPQGSQPGTDEQPRFQPPQRERNFDRGYNNDRPHYGERQDGGDRDRQGGDRQGGDRPDRFQRDRFQNDRGPRQDRGAQDRGAQDRGPQDRGGQDRPAQDRGPQDRAAQDRPVQDRPFEGQQGGYRGEEGGEADRGFNPRQNRNNRRDGRFGDRPYQDRQQSERQPYQDRSFQPQPVVPLDQPQPDIGDDAALTALPSFITGPAPAIAAPAATEGEGEARFPRRPSRGSSPSANNL